MRKIPIGSGYDGMTKAALRGESHKIHEQMDDALAAVIEDLSKYKWLLGELRQIQIAIDPKEYEKLKVGYHQNDVGLAITINSFEEQRRAVVDVREGLRGLK